MDTCTEFCRGGAKEKDQNGRPTSARNLLKLRVPKQSKNFFTSYETTSLQEVRVHITFLSNQVFFNVVLCNWFSSSRRFEKSWCLKLQLLAEQQMMYFMFMAPCIADLY